MNHIYSFAKDGLMRETDDEIGAPFPSCIQDLYREVHDQANLPDAEKTNVDRGQKEHLHPGLKKDRDSTELPP